MINEIKKKLKKRLKCNSLEIINESIYHKGHKSIEKQGVLTSFDGEGETHLRIIISSPDFDNMSKIKTHKMIYEILKDEIKQLHALAIQIL